MRYPKVTIHVTVKNARGTIKKCIDSLFRLNYPTKEIWVTDAYSIDGTWEILERCKRKIKLFRIRGNAPKAHNYVIRKVKTPFLAFTDADCIVDRNWLRNLINGFTSKDIIATAGYCSTPEKVNWLQQLIGKELEMRFKKHFQFLPHAPTMNFCIRTKIAKKVKMDEKLDVAFETDWGFRLEKYGKIKYVPSARVFHYHRPTWASYLKQQFIQAKFTPFVYTKSARKFLRNLFCVQKDPISTPRMTFQINLCALWLSFLFISIFNFIFFLISLGIFFVLVLTYLLDAARLSENTKEFVLFFFLFFIRNIVWLFGIITGFLCLFRRRVSF